MTETQWLYDLIAALDRITDEAQVVDEVPNIKEWVESIQAEERERCVNALREQWRFNDLIAAVTREQGASDE